MGHGSCVLVLCQPMRRERREKRNEKPSHVKGDKRKKKRERDKRKKSMTLKMMAEEKVARPVLTTMSPCSHAGTAFHLHTLTPLHPYSLTTLFHPSVGHPPSHR